MKLASIPFQLRLQLDRLQVRERALLVLALVMVILALMVAGGHYSGLTQHDSERQRINDLRSELSANRNALESLTEARDNPRIARLSEIKQTLEARLAELDESLANITDILIPPQQMVAVLRELVDRNDLTLVRLELQPVIQVRDADDGQSALYEHRLRLTLNGSFDDLSDYLSALEGLPWHFFWDRLSIETTDYPQLRIRLDVHTLSDQEVWMNV